MKKLLIITLIIISSYAQGMKLELDLSAGAQSSWPVAGQFGYGGAANFKIANIVLFPYLSMNMVGVEYINKKVYFKEVNYGAGLKLLFSKILTRATFGRMYRTYGGLKDESWRVGVGAGANIGFGEMTLNYYYYLPLEKKAVVLMLGIIF